MISLIQFIMQIIPFCVDGIFVICHTFCSLDAAEETTFAVKEGDIVVLATDGLFDNVSEEQIIDEISKLKVNISSSKWTICIID